MIDALINHTTITTFRLPAPWPNRRLAALCISRESIISPFFISHKSHQIKQDLRGFLMNANQFGSAKTLLDEADTENVHFLR